MIKNIIFDFDGVIADGLVAITSAINVLAKKYSFTQVDTQTLKATGQGEWIKKNVPKDQLGPLLLEARELISAMLPTIPLIGGMREVLLELQKDYFMGIVSSNSRENIRQFLAKNSLDSVFGYVEIDDSFIGKEKTLLGLLQKKNFVTTNSVYVADETRDILACRQIDLPIISVTWGYESEQNLLKSQPKLLARTPSDIFSCLKQLN